MHVLLKIVHGQDVYNGALIVKLVAGWQEE